jgi:hypothetical protein
VFRIIVHIALASILIGSFIACDNPFAAAKQQAEPANYVGSWKLSFLAQSTADSIQRKQWLILRSDSTYSCSFSLLTLNARDTTRFSNPYQGTWQTTISNGEFPIGKDVGVRFFADSGSNNFGWDNIGGSVREGVMHFTNDAMGGSDRNLSWILQK